MRRFISGHNNPMGDPVIVARQKAGVTKAWDKKRGHPLDRAGYLKQWHLENRSRRLAAERERKHNRKIMVLTKYGNGICACLWCGFDTLAALTLDHINDDGYLDSRSGHDLYLHLLQSEFPEGYQTLCMNCQYIKREEVARSSIQ